MIIFFKSLSPIYQALIASLFTWSITILGASIVFFFKKVNKTIMDSLLGFSAGVMIAASFWSLLDPAINMAQELKFISWLIVFIGFFSGGLLLFIGDKLFSTISKKNKCCNSKFKRCIMLLFSITLHNIPEGLVIGVAFGSLLYSYSGSSLASAITLAFGIGLQNFPER